MTTVIVATDAILEKPPTDPAEPPDPVSVAAVAELLRLCRLQGDDRRAAGEAYYDPDGGPDSPEYQTRMERWRWRAGELGPIRPAEWAVRGTLEARHGRGDVLRELLEYLQEYSLRLGVGDPTDDLERLDGHRLVKDEDSQGNYDEPWVPGEGLALVRAALVVLDGPSATEGAAA